MNEREAAKFAQTIKRQAWHQVKVKRGKTNGKHTFHIIDTEAKDTRLASTTIYTVADWLVHPLNSINKPQTKKPLEDGDLAQFTREFTSFTAGLQATMGRLTEAAVAAAASTAALRVPEQEGA